MIEIPANPNLETLKIVMWVAVGIIVMLLAIVGYFVRVHLSGEKGRIDKLTAVVDTLRETVTTIKGIVDIIKKEQEERDPRTERRLNDHACKLSRHDKAIVRIETKLNIRNKDTEEETE